MDRKMKGLSAQFAQNNVFRELSDQDRQSLAKAGVKRSFAPGQYLCHQGELWPKVVFVVSGRLRWTMLAVSGKEHILFTVEHGQAFWGHSLFDDQPMPASLMAALATQVYLWPREVILPILFRNPKALWELTKMQVDTMRKAREIIYGLAFKPVAGRLAKFLLDRSSENEPIQRDLTLSEIAAMLASSQEVVCRLLYQFQEDGLLEVSRASITLHNRKALETLIESE
jgi:CRP-like cAMP-binding protein